MNETNINTNPPVAYLLLSGYAANAGLKAGYAFICAVGDDFYNVDRMKAAYLRYVACAKEHRNYYVKITLPNGRAFFKIGVTRHTVAERMAQLPEGVVYEDATEGLYEEVFKTRRDAYSFEADVLRIHKRYLTSERGFLGATQGEGECFDIDVFKRARDGYPQLSHVADLKVAQNRSEDV